MRRLALLFAAAALAACQKPETPEQASMRMAAEADSARRDIEAVNVRYARYLNGNHADSVAMLFMANGVTLPPNAPAAVGRDSIRAALTRNPMPPGATLTFNVVDVAANGPLAVERGTFAFNMPAMGRNPAMTSTGKYLAHWHRVDGQWMIAADIWNDDAPPAPAPPARK